MSPYQCEAEEARMPYVMATHCGPGGGGARESAPLSGGVVPPRGRRNSYEYAKITTSNDITPPNKIDLKLDRHILRREYPLLSKRRSRNLREQWRDVEWATRASVHDVGHVRGLKYLTFQ
ncbi:hypothetical protein EVAR_15656_1 [Eumeta japonica]|uniref:Uncharacterized protein n=1 Tax=Eumeta variegata TaxID=151549 RepID=A0A4C1U9C4_EUMVA|nr:hypothetical protein EVAR_15656_1 [Eumeta japonica]